MTILEELIEKKKELDALIHEQGAQMFNEYFQSVFEKYPELRSFSFKSYTPYFNDGDPCEHMVSQFYYDVPSYKDVPPYDAESDDYYYSEEEYLEVNALSEYSLDFSWEGDWPDRRKVYSTPLDTKLGAMMEEIEGNLSAISDAVQLGLGDHISVRVTREGIEIEEYEHD